VVAQAIYASYAFVGLVLLYLWSLSPAHSPERRQGAFLLMWCWALLLMTAGVVPHVWTGLLSKVQFSWRLLIAVDLLLAVLIVMLAGCHRAGRGVILLCFAGIALTFAVMFIAILVAAKDHQFTIPSEPLEYRAAGYLSGAIDPTGPLVVPPEAGAVQTSWQGEKMMITVSADRDARVVVPINYFPSWVVSDAQGNAVDTAAETPSRLLSFEVKPGESQFIASRILLPEERTGWLVSLAAAVLTAAAAVLTLLQRRGRRS
jgi:hypothetical protein